jgi:protoheme ferro-lyase
VGDIELEYDSVLVVSFGGPEQRADVMPFLENVVRGKNVPSASRKLLLTTIISRARAR